MLTYLRDHRIDFPVSALVCRAFGITYVYWGFMGVMPESAWDSIEMKPVADYLDTWQQGTASYQLISGLTWTRSINTNKPKVQKPLLCSWGPSEYVNIARQDVFIHGINWVLLFVSCLALGSQRYDQMAGHAENCCWILRELFIRIY